MDTQKCWCFPLSSLTYFMLSLTMRAPVKADKPAQTSWTLCAWQKQKSWRTWMALWSGKRLQMFISGSLVGNWGLPHYWPLWSEHLLIIVWSPVGPKANYWQIVLLGNKYLHHRKKPKKPHCLNQGPQATIWQTLTFMEAGNIESLSYALDT